MKQTGRVLSVSGEQTVISVIRQIACGDSCASCSAKCSLKDTTVVAHSIDGIEKGDTVIFEMAASKVLFAAFLVYITPLIVLLIAYFTGAMMGFSEGVCALFGIGAMALWFLAVYFIDKKLLKYYKHTIVNKVEGEI